MALDFSTLTEDDKRELVKMVQTAQLLEAQDELDKQQGAMLHNEKNAPWAPGGYYEKALKALKPNPSLTGRPIEYPKMLYSVDYPAAQREYQAAVRFRERRDMPGERDELIKRAEFAMQAATLTVRSAAEERQARDSSLWHATGADALKAEEQRQQAIAEAALVSASDDRRMGELARRERDAADAASEGHLVEVPEQKRGPGRPRST